MKTVNDEVTVKLTGVDGKEITIKKPVSFVELENSDDVLTYAQDKDNLAALIAAANYGFNLKARAKVTAQIKAENQGPEVSVNRHLAQMEKNYEKSGKPFDKEAARAFILANLAMFGIAESNTASA